MHTWTQIIDDFLTARAAAESWDVKTYKFHQARLAPFSQFLADRSVKRPQEIERRDIERYLADLKTAGLSWSTRNGTYTSLSLFFGWLAGHELITRNPFEGTKRIKRPRKEEQIRDVIAEPAYRIMIKAAKADPSIFGRRDEAIMRVLLNTGMRRKELVNLRQKDYDPLSRKLSIRKGGKYNKQRIVFVYAPTARAIDAWLAVRPETSDPVLFLTLHAHKRGKYTQMDPNAINDLLHKWKVRTGLPSGTGVSPHKWRHRFGTDFSARGGDCMILQPLMGHSDITITRGYVHNNEEILRRMADIFCPGDDLDDEADDLGDGADDLDDEAGELVPA